MDDYDEGQQGNKSIVTAAKSICCFPTLTDSHNADSLRSLHITWNTYLSRIAQLK